MTGDDRHIEGRELVAVPADIRDDATLKGWLDAIATQTRVELQKLRGDVSRDRLVEWAESAPGELGTIARAYVTKLDDYEKVVNALDDRDTLIATLNRQVSDLSGALDQATQLYTAMTERAKALAGELAELDEIARNMEVEPPPLSVGLPETVGPVVPVEVVETKPEGFVAGVLNMFGAALGGYIDTWRKHPMEMGATHAAFFALRSMSQDRDNAWAECISEEEAHDQTMDYFVAEMDRVQAESAENHRQFMHELAVGHNEADRAEAMERERDEARLQLGAKADPVEVHIHNEIPQQSETDRELARDISRDEATDSTRQMALEIDQEAVRDTLRAEARAEMRENPQAYRGPRGPQGKAGKAGTTKTIQTVVHKRDPTPRSEPKAHGESTHTRELITLRPTTPRADMTEATRRMVEKTRKPKGDV